MSLFSQFITAKDNPSVKLYRKLSAAKKSRQQEGLFVLEGYRLVSDALANNARITLLFITESASLKWGEELLSLVENSVKIMYISDELGKYMAETESTQGVFAVCRIPVEKSWDDFLKSDGVYAVLCRLQDPGNAGMILRTADALGIDGVVFCGSCDIYSPKVVRATMGSLFRVSVKVCSDERKIFKNFDKYEISSDAAVVRDADAFVGSCTYNKGCAVWIGNEGSGLSKEISDACNRKVTIPMYGNIESLNAAMAAGVLMWEMTKGRHML